MDYVVKTYTGSEDQTRRLRHLLDASLDIVEEYFTAPYNELVQSKSYSTQQIAAAYMTMAHYALRSTSDKQTASDLFDLIAFCAKERNEENIEKSGKDPFRKKLT